MAANAFGITQTEEKIYRSGVRGQRLVGGYPQAVGKQVRKAMKEISEVTPESLTPAEEIRKVKKGSKGGLEDVPEDG
jgi:hypothetical protein